MTHDNKGVNRRGCVVLLLYSDDFFASTLDVCRVFDPAESFGGGEV